MMLGAGPIHPMALLVPLRSPHVFTPDTRKPCIELRSVSLPGLGQCGARIATQPIGHALYKPSRQRQSAQHAELLTLQLMDKLVANVVVPPGLRAFGPITVPMVPTVTADRSPNP